MLKQSSYGNFVAVYDLGVFIIGPSGVGKSRLSLELASRGHAMIADDITLFVESNQEVIGFCPRRNRSFICLDGKVETITKLCSQKATRRSAKVGLIYHLLTGKGGLHSFYRPPRIVDYRLLGQSFPEYLCSKLPISAQAKHLEKIVLKLKSHRDIARLDH